MTKIFILVLITIGFIGLSNGQSRDTYGRTSPSLEAFSTSTADATVDTKPVIHGIQFASYDPLPEGVVKYKYYQTYRDTTLEVLGGEVIVFTYRLPDESVYQETVDNLYDVNQTIALTVVYTSAQAVTIAKANCTKCTNAAADTRLAIYSTAYSKTRKNYNGNGYFVWRVQLSLPTDHIVYMVDATSGAIRFIQDETRRYNALTKYDGTQTIPSYYVTSQYYLEEAPSNSSVVSCVAGNCTVNTMYGDIDGVWNDTIQQIPAQVMYGVSQVLSYVSSVHGRDGIDGYGGPQNILSADGISQHFAHKVHSGANQTFSQWHSSGIMYGDGDGIQYGPLVSVDIVAHEIGHGIMQYTANLNSAGEPGALEESFGDVLAALVDRNIHGERNNTWQIGEDDYTPAIVGDAIRRLDNPHLADNTYGYTADDDPDHYTEMYTGVADNGGIHTNAGIPNKVFYMLSKGGIHHMNTSIIMTGLGVDAAAAIWWRAYTYYASSTTTFAGMRDNMERSARDLYGTNENFEVGVAWGLCGVGSVPTPTPLQRVTNYDFAAATGWVITQTTGTGVVSVDRALDAHSGVKYMKFGAANSVAGSITTTFSIPGNASTADLSYWAWVTGTDSLTVANDKLFVELYSNDTSTFIAQVDLISNRNASTTWYQRTVNLMSYKSYVTMKLVVRVLTDFNLPTTFKIDDVGVLCNVY